MQYDGRTCEWCGDQIDVFENPGGHYHDDCLAEQGEEPRV